MIENSVNSRRVCELLLLEGVDALVTDVPGKCICVSTADCVPVMCFDTKQGVVAAIHAGWQMVDGSTYHNRNVAGNEPYVWNTGEGCCSLYRS